MSWRFNPRTRTGCDTVYIRPQAFCVVSTHAPARGATDCSKTIIRSRGFQPTHPHGVRLSRVLRFSTSWQFQPTHPHGVRPRRLLLALLGIVSTHAPARGATAGHCYIWRSALRFNPRTRTGCDLPGVGVRGQNYGFNPRTRTGCDRWLLSPIVNRYGFNPRTRTGCDR